MSSSSSPERQPGRMPVQSRSLMGASAPALWPVWAGEAPSVPWPLAPACRHLLPPQLPGDVFGGEPHSPGETPSQGGGHPGEHPLPDVDERVLVVPHALGCQPRAAAASGVAYRRRDHPRRCISPRLRGMHVPAECCPPSASGCAACSLPQRRKRRTRSSREPRPPFPAPTY